MATLDELRRRATAAEELREVYRREWLATPTTLTAIRYDTANALADEAIRDFLATDKRAGRDRPGVAGRPLLSRCSICNNPNCDEPNGKH